MLFTLMRIEPDSIIPITGCRIQVDLDGRIIEGPFSIDEAEGKLARISGTVIEVHIIDTKQRSSRERDYYSYIVPVVFRKSKLVLVGNDGRLALNSIIERVLKTEFNIELQGITPYREKLFELLSNVHRADRVIMGTERGDLPLEDLLEYLDAFLGDKISRKEMERFAVISYPLLSAELVFKPRRREIILRYYLDSFWISERDPKEDVDEAVSMLEYYLLGDFTHNEHQIHY